MGRLEMLPAHPSRVPEHASQARHSPPGRPTRRLGQLWHESLGGELPEPFWCGCRKVTDPPCLQVTSDRYSRGCDCHRGPSTPQKSDGPPSHPACQIGSPGPKALCLLLPLRRAPNLPTQVLKKVAKPHKIHEIHEKERKSKKGTR